MSCFFLLMAIVSALSDRGFNNCCCLWCFQLPLYGALFVGAYAIPNDFFYGYAWVARVSSVLFLVLQIIIIVDTTYNVRDYLVDKIDVSDADERVSLLSSSAPSSSRFPTWFWYYFLLHPRDCIPVTLEDGPGLLPPSILSLYIAFLCYESVSANPNAAVCLPAIPLHSLDITHHVDISTSQCNPFLTYQATSTANTVVASLIGAATITWTRHADGAAMWVHITSQWVSIAVYMWTLVAPYLVPDREFR
ncbi:hypothetical protein DYB25_001662 [Aphanomyces astaci]|uniref:Uncharacterized protein n=1 Tax=Aphanomyces astaci TaxID=112090 RepID=A0A397B9S6_APHAT|nr:hypothetical protein DYB25_001662 [Aphanomyces astaci]